MVPLQASMGYLPTLSCLAPGHSPQDDISLLMNSGLSGNMPSQDEYAIPHTVEANIRSEDIARIGGSSFGVIGSSSRGSMGCDIPKQGSLLHGMPDFSEVYSFIGSVFDPDTKGHLQKLKEMYPVNFETVLLLMRNLTTNLSSPDFDPIKKVLSSYDANAAAGAIATNQNNDHLPH